ncbi:MAG: hypothetical protein ACYSUD_13125, partial [Planctomycetota bacterium]|jgi:hypothetical protein
MPKTIPETTLRDPVETDIYRAVIRWVPDEDNPGEEIVNVAIAYQLVEEATGEVYDRDRRIDPEALAAFKNAVDGLRRSQLLKEVEDFEGF